MRKSCSVLLLLLLLTPAAFAAAPIEDVSFDSPEQEARYEDLIEVLRCPKCLNVNLAGSDAPIAAIMRAEVREQLAEGRTDEEIKEFMVARYGEFVLYKPRLTAGTALLWFGPLILLLAGFFILQRVLASQRGAATEAALSPEERQKLQSLLGEDKGGQ